MTSELEGAFEAYIRFLAPDLAAGMVAEFLVQAQDNGWPVKELSRQIAAAIGKPVPPRLLYDDMGAVWQVAEVARPYLVLLGDMSALTEGMKVRVKVYEAEAEAQS